MIQNIQIKYEILPFRTQCTRNTQPSITKGFYNRSKWNNRLKNIHVLEYYVNEPLIFNETMNKFSQTFYIIFTVKSIKKTMKTFCIGLSSAGCCFFFDKASRHIWMHVYSLNPSSAAVSVIIINFQLNVML